MWSEVINYPAVLVAAVASFLLGWLWHGPIFGKQWMAMMGFTPESVKAMKMKPVTAMALGFLSLIVMACVLAQFAAAWGAEGVAGAASLAFWVWLGFIAMVHLGSVLWENRSFKLYLFNVVYQFAVVFLMSLILVLWQ